MQNLTRASNELFRRTPDECFATLPALWQKCQNDRQASLDRWHPPQAIKAEPAGGRFRLILGQDGGFNLNDWSFGQLCRLAGASKDTVNRVSSDTATRILHDTLPTDGKPLQALTMDESIRAIHGASYTRLYNVDLLTVVREFATDFQAPQKAGVTVGEGTGAVGDVPFDPDPTPADTRGTGLYCGEQDMFCFLIDPTGWTEINGEAFAPGFFVWNSEVGRRSVGVQTFWFQAVCQNHIVWDAVDVVEFSRKHTANVHDSLNQIRDIILNLVEKRDQRRDGFAEVIKKAMGTRLGEDADKVTQLLADRGFTRALAKEAVEIAQQTGRLTVFSVVDALTRLSGKMGFAGDRTAADVKAGQLLTLVT